VGRARTRKKAQRQAGPSSHQAKQKSQADAAIQQAMLQVAGALTRMCIRVGGSRLPGS
jgi:hypothetical protein